MATKTIHLPRFFESSVQGLRSLLGDRRKDKVNGRGMGGTVVGHEELHHAGLVANRNRVSLFGDVVLDQIKAEEGKLRQLAGVKSVDEITKNPDLRRRFSEQLHHINDLEGKRAEITAAIKNLDKDIESMNKTMKNKSPSRN